MHQNLHAGTLNVFRHRAQLWWHLSGKQCMAEVDLTADRILDLGQTGWVRFEKTHSQDDPERMNHEFKVIEPELLAEYLGIDLFDLNHLTS